MKKNELPFSLQIILLSFALVLINVLAAFSTLSVDVTESQIYTLSNNTKTLLNHLPSKNPIEITLYFSESHKETPPMAKAFVKRIATLLAQYAKINPQIKFNRVDPIPDSDEEENARTNGIVGERLSNGENLYLGLSIKSIDKKITLGAVTINQEPMLEYQVTTAIMQLLNEKKPTIGILSSVKVLSDVLSTMPELDDSYLTFKALKERYHLDFLSLDPYTFNPSIDTHKMILIFNPMELPEMVIYKLDQYLLKGGNIALFMDAYAFSSATTSMGVPPAASFEPLLSHWGIKLSPNPIVDLTTAVREGNSGYLWIQMLKVNNPSQISKQSPITASLKEFDFLAPGSFLIIEKKPHIKLTPLIVTSSQTTTYPLPLLLENKPVSQTELANHPQQRHLIAAQLKGKFTSAFKSKPYLTNKNDDIDEIFKRKEAHHQTEATAEGEVILIADIDAFHNQVTSQTPSKNINTLIPANDNFYLFQNTVDVLAGQADMLSIRVKPPSVRPLEKILALRQKAAETYHALLSGYEKELETITEQIARLQKPGTLNDGKLIIDEQMQEKLDKLEAQRKAIIKQLKIIRREVRREIDSLQFTLELVNMFLFPVLLAFVGLGIYFYRKRKCRARHKKA